jgi:hypothetical protein
MVFDLKISGLYYKHTTIVNYASCIINKLKALLTDDARVVIYDCHVYIVQATGVVFTTLPFLTNGPNKLDCLSLARLSSLV